MECEDERPPPPGSDFAQRVAYVIYAVSALVTILFAQLVMLVIGLMLIYGL